MRHSAEIDDEPRSDSVLAALFREHRESLVASASRRADPGVAEDVVQRVFEKVWRRSPALADVKDPIAYIATAVRNETHRDLRRRMVAREREVLVGTETVEFEQDPADVSCMVTGRAAVTRELTRLPPRQRQAIVLRWEWQLSVEETAAVMGVSIGSVKSYSHHGLRKLRRAFVAA